MKVNKELSKMLRTLRSLGMCNSVSEALEWLSERIWVRIYEKAPMHVWAAYISGEAFVCKPDFVEIRVTFNKKNIIIVINNYAILDRSELSEPESRRFVFENNNEYPAVEPLDILYVIEDRRKEYASE